MKQSFFKPMAVALVAFAVPFAALADLSNTVTLPSGTALNLDTGATSTSGGDILFTGTSITFQGNAKGGNLGNFGAAGFAAINQTVLVSLAGGATTNPIPASDLVVGDVFAVSTNGGNLAAVLVTASSSSSITLQYTTFGATGGGPGTPTITKVLNNYSIIEPGFPNYGLAPGSLIVIVGTNLANAPTGTVTLASSSGTGIPTTLAGASVSVTVGGKTVTPGMYYAIPTQIAAVLPNGTPTGTGTLTVTYNKVASAAFQIQVVPSAMGLDALYGAGSGPGIATDPITGKLFSSTNSVNPGSTIVLWGSGLGANPAISDYVYQPGDFPVNVPLQIYFGGVPGTVSYGGASGYPGVNVINVGVPPNAPTGCNVSVVAVSGNNVSNFVTLPLNQGGGTCSDSIFGIDGNTISSLSSQATVRSGDVIVAQLVSPDVNTGTPKTTNIAEANFQSVTGASYGGSSSGLLSLGSCLVTQTFTSGSGTIPTEVGLDPGNVSTTGPLGTYPLKLIPTLKGFYDALLPDGAIPSTGGSFTTSWTGGADVGASSVSISFPNPILNWTNQGLAAAINRPQGLLVTWSGGTPGSFVYIAGDSTDNNGVSGSYVCYAPQSALQFTVPAYVLDTLPAATGSTTVENITNYTRFKATGLDFGFAVGFTGISVKSTYQ